MRACCGAETATAGITAEEHYNRHGYHYVYYHCTHNRTFCAKSDLSKRKSWNDRFWHSSREISLDKEQTDEALAIVNKQKEEDNQHGDAPIPREIARYVQEEPR